MFGFVTTVIWGGFILILGYAMLALPSHGLLFYPGLATIVIGTACLKPSISSLLGAQYHTDDPRRDSGFTIFYIVSTVALSSPALALATSRCVWLACQFCCREHRAGYWCRDVFSMD